MQIQHVQHDSNKTARGRAGFSEARIPAAYLLLLSEKSPALNLIVETKFGVSVDTYVSDIARNKVGIVIAHLYTNVMREDSFKE